MLKNLLKSPLFISAMLFLLALTPRLLNLDQFLTADEFLWVDRSRNFLAGLLNSGYECTTVVEKWASAQGLACTLRTGHPGVTTMWTGAFGFVLAWLAHARSQPLFEFVVNAATNPLDPNLILPERLGTVLLVSVWVVALYWLLRRLFGQAIALTTAVLIALDPFHIALSRVIHHDALSTTFMTLSALTALIYWGQRAGRGWLLVSGLLAGLGLLSKSPALYLLPFTALVGFWFFGESRLKKTADPLNFTTLVLDGLLWFGLILVTVFLFWPAMWVIPREAVETVLFIGSKYATGGHAKGNYFLGEISNDPGALFYPVTWLYRTSPLVMVGLVGLLGGWLVSLLTGWRGAGSQQTSAPNAASSVLSQDRYQGFFRYLPLILLYIFGYYLLMTIGEKKQDRYFLPVYPWLDLIAAAGLVLIADGLARLISSRTSAPRTPTSEPRHPKLITHHSSLITRHSSLPILLLILIVHGAFISSHYPYYFTYYNPLLGGPTAAAKAVTVGWGEGLDLAAAYLNEQVDHSHVRVTSWYESTFAPYYLGRSISYSEEKGKALAGDYVIFYINQLQREFPDTILFEYFSRRSSPKQVINLHGLDYVWIYPSLGIDHYVTDQTYSGIASLLAWQWRQGDDSLRPGQAAEFDLYWEYLGKAPDEPFFLRLVDAQGRAWAEGRSRLMGQLNPPPDTWRQGEIIYERGALLAPADMPPGQYELQIGIFTDAPAVPEGELLFALHPGDERVTVGHHPAPDFELPPAAESIDQPLGQSLTLLGATLPADPVAPETQAALELFWRVEQPLPADAALHVGLMDSAGDARQAWFDLSLAETFAPEATVWQPGDILRSRWTLDLLPEVPPGDYRLELVLPDDTSQILPAGKLVIRP